jgi:hypothetical protein
MNDKRIIYPGENGIVAIISPALEAKRSDESYDEFVLRIANKDVPAGLPYKIIDASQLPNDRTFRNAWEYTA